ncbi:DUF732 domain-containing protein [Mycobacterium mantenii]|uniref:DUF732 domain-containing protein n=1 Tax=Mycobacterium mantenii TaxID=560555 RepID=A0A1A2ST37_MYCNT|nr:DUF732 domain-containing protein [Mycobacterium mantenii]OBH41752.1 hypothetical protein A5688_17210 [Mycobacterium mantenii]OBH59601.1 hypothetical protein A5687_03010 [Mycobacterium mantenii]OBH67281.1 hypothetical protein A5682_13780 [Mycobacterium mantenii]OBH81055.1 hypothetical protein A5683_14255 [Mycobacterium mantenii]
MRVGSGKWPAACAMLLCTAALAFATPAFADRSDDAFIAGLSKGGITMPDNNDAIAKARAVCTSIAVNPNASVLAIQLARQTPLSVKQSAYFVGLSIATYCPQYKDDIDPSVIWLLPGPPLM